MHLLLYILYPSICSNCSERESCNNVLTYITSSEKYKLVKKESLSDCGACYHSHNSTPHDLNNDSDLDYISSIIVPSVLAVYSVLSSREWASAGVSLCKACSFLLSVSSAIMLSSLSFKTSVAEDSGPITLILLELSSHISVWVDKSKSLLFINAAEPLAQLSWELPPTSISPGSVLGSIHSSTCISTSTK